MGIIKSLLDTDFYKYSMGQMAFHRYYGKKVKYQFVCRNKDIDLTPYKSQIEQEVDELVKLKISDEEINYLRTLNDGIFQEDYLNYLKSFKLNRKELNIFIKDGKLNIEAEGEWQSAIFWEIFVLSIVNEVYFRNTQPNANKQIGLKNLYEKISLVKEVNKDSVLFSFMEFGTRRRYSLDWQKEVCSVLKKELLGNGFIGTSNIHLGMELEIPVLGTIAHEAFQFHQGVDFEGSTSFFSSNPLMKYYNSQQNTLIAWLNEYKEKLSIALSDIFGTDAFLSVLDKDLSEKYQGLRHDSGSPYEWADKVINHYEKLNIDPKTKILVFSDGLNFPKAKDILSYVNGRAKVTFGIGTCLTNDFDFKAMNIVMKMIEADGNSVVKISDEPSKAIGDKKVIEVIKNHFNIEE